MSKYCQPNFRLPIFVVHWAHVQTIPTAAIIVLVLERGNCANKMHFVMYGICKIIFAKMNFLEMLSPVRSPVAEVAPK